MSCCCESEFPLLGGLLGAIPQQLPEIAGGAPFNFGYNIGYAVPGRDRAGEVAKVLEDLALSYDTHSWWVAGHLNPYLAIEGYAVTSWPSASQFAEEIYRAVKDAGHPIEYGSIQFRFEPYQASVVPTPPPMVGTPHPGTQTPVTTKPPSGSGAPPPDPDDCDFDTQDFGDYVACLLGIKSAVGGVAAGAAGALVGVGVLTLMAVVLLKR